MNLHAIANRYISAVNPNSIATLRISAGYVTNLDGKRVPQYAPPVTVQAQVQSLANIELRQIESLNIQGIVSAAYLYGDINGLVRLDKKGGDLLTIDGQDWLIVVVLENWPG